MQIIIEWKPIKDIPRNQRKALFMTKSGLIVTVQKNDRGWFIIWKGETLAVQPADIVYYATCPEELQQMVKSQYEQRLAQMTQRQFMKHLFDATFGEASWEATACRAEIEQRK